MKSNTETTSFPLAEHPNFDLSSSFYFFLSAARHTEEHPSASSTGSMVRSPTNGRPTSGSKELVPSSPSMENRKDESTMMKATSESGSSEGTVTASASATAASDPATQTAQKDMLKKPKRPLSAYNLFFRDQREFLLDVLPQRKRNRGHGKITFQDMGRIIGQRWKEIDVAEKARYEAQAAVGRAVYVKQAAEWKRLQNLKNPPKPKNQKPKPAALRKPRVNTRKATMTNAFKTAQRARQQETIDITDSTRSGISCRPTCHPSGKTVSHETSRQDCSHHSGNYLNGPRKNISYASLAPSQQQPSQHHEASLIYPQDQMNMMMTMSLMDNRDMKRMMTMNIAKNSNNNNMEVQANTSPTLLPFQGASTLDYSPLWRQQQSDQQPMPSQTEYAQQTSGDPCAFLSTTNISAFDVDGHAPYMNVHFALPSYEGPNSQHRSQHYDNDTFNLEPVPLEMMTTSAKATSFYQENSNGSCYPQQQPLPQQPMDTLANRLGRDCVDLFVNLMETAEGYDQHFAPAHCR